MTVFDAFFETEYELLKIERGTIKGNKIVEILGDRSGVFKAKSGMKRGANGEVYSAQSVLYARPEDFYFEPVGQGVRISGKDFQIVASVDGLNQVTGEIEHLKLTLEPTDYEH